MKNISETLKRALILLLAFFLFTLCIKTIGVRTVVPAYVVDDEAASEAEIVDREADDETSFSLGFAGLNVKLQHLLGYHHSLETLTKLLGYAALLIVAAFGCLGLSQLVKSKSLRGVDPQIIVLGIYYVIVLVCYFLFEKLIVNYRPVVLDEGLEASYPSSHTILVIAVMATMGSQAVRYVPFLKKNENILNIACYGIIGIMILFRLLSGVHWFTDIIGGILIALALVYLYRSACEFFFGSTDSPKQEEKKITASKPKNPGKRGGAHLA